MYLYNICNIAQMHTPFLEMEQPYPCLLIFMFTESKNLQKRGTKHIFISITYFSCLQDNFTYQVFVEKEKNNFSLFAFGLIIVILLQKRNLFLFYLCNGVSPHETYLVQINHLSVAQLAKSLLKSAQVFFLPLNLSFEKNEKYFYYAIKAFR